MYKFLFLTLISLSLFTLCACNEEETKVVEDEPEYTTIVSDIEKIEIEIDETYNLGYIVSLNEGMKVEVKDDSVVEIKDNVVDFDGEVLELEDYFEDIYINDSTIIIENQKIIEKPDFYGDLRVYISAQRIDGDYIASKITIPLTYNGTMSITANKLAESIL